MNQDDNMAYVIPLSHNKNKSVLLCNLYSESPHNMYYVVFFFRKTPINLNSKFGKS